MRFPWDEKLANTSTSTYKVVALVMPLIVSIGLQVYCSCCPHHDMLVRVVVERLRSTVRKNQAKVETFFSLFLLIHSF